MRVLKEKEGLSINLAEKTDEVGRMAMENERLRKGIEDVRNEAKDLISTGMSYIEYTNSQGGGHMSN
jgi:regulator of replication initiation timing